MWFYFCSVFLQIQFFVTDLVTLTGYLIHFFFNSEGGQETNTVENHMIKLAGKYYC